MADFVAFCDDDTLTLRGSEHVLAVRLHQRTDEAHRQMLREAFVKVVGPGKKPLGILFVTATHARRTGDDTSRRFMIDSLRAMQEYAVACAIVVEEHGVLAAVRRAMATSVLLSAGAKNARLFGEVPSAARWLQPRLVAAGAPPSLSVNAMLRAVESSQRRAALTIEAEARV